MTLLLFCPWGDKMHPTDDPDGGPCSECVEYADEQLKELNEDTMLGMLQKGDIL